MTTPTTNVSNSKAALNDDQASNDSHSKDTSSPSYLQEDDDDSVTFRSRKSYPQRNNRPKLNYRDLERGVYDAYEIRQSQWALGGPSRNNQSSKNNEYSDNEEDDDNDNEDMTTDDDNNKSTDDTDQLHRRLWCICKKPWDHSRLMLRCDSCANWYHGDCIGVTKEQARVLEMNGDQFVCPPCRKVTVKPSGRSSDESVLIKRKRIDAISPSDRRIGEKNGSTSSTKNLTQSEPSKRPKTGIFFQRDSPAEPQIHCIVHGCSNWAKVGWVYCSPACIRRHINETLQAIQRSKGANNDNPPTREDILLYENRTKKLLDRKLIPKVEDLCTWINQHPSYEIVKPALRQSILLTANQTKSNTSTNFARSSSINASTTPKTPTTPTSIKPKLSWASGTPNAKPVPIKKAPVQLGRQTSNTPSSPTVQNYADIRMKVPQALYDKLVMRLEKSGDKNISKDEVKTIVDKIEEEMYRVYGKVDNSYKNKFRSLLANISNMNNNFFYKHILSKETTAKQIVAMKPEDMLPPEEKEKRKDEFEKEVQMIMKANEETAEEMARRARTKNTRQGLVDNDIVLQHTNESSVIEQVSAQSKESKPTSNKPIVKTKKPAQPKPPTEIKNVPVPSPPKAVPESIVSQPSPPPPPPPPPKPIEEPVKAQIPSPVREDPTPMYSALDLDNDYIEPESPTGIDALLYDDDDDFSTSNTHSRSSSIQQQTSHPESPGDNHDYLPTSAQQTVRDDYNPLTASKPKTELPSMYQPTPISRSISEPIQWRGAILLPDSKLLCQSVHIYGESDYLVSDIPEQLSILGRLRLGDLWDYVRGSLPGRDITVLTITSTNSDDTNAFSRYIDTLRSTGRAAVMNKRTEPSSIRDMYILPADTKDCPANVISTLGLSMNVDPKQLFLVVVGSGKRTSRTTPANKSNESQFTYKPVSLQETAVRRDPRLVKNKDPRLASSSNSEVMTSLASAGTTTLIPNQFSTDDLVKLMSQSIERIRQAPSTDVKQSIIMSTLEILKSNNREDLCKRYTNDAAKYIGANTAVTVDNLNEENMEVEDEQDNKYDKQLELNEFNDVDYRLLDQDMDHRMSD